ncbi:hypothetical protein FNV43_RR15519 [Rhamnella rubrinervis]|uniref:Secoisolariciresinol dehydrogenase n=1 Tax=Rhamnella rubrinervis TaxID=2594499 RepID=A0A8K0E919_9ROSA|nr:hypothetical protein FNV43_RR15519 [Rhamnella rubrinervis]
MYVCTYRLAGKVALITGGASGIGESTVRLFARQGAKVVIADVQDDQGHSVCESIGSDDSVSYVHCDVSKENDVQNAVDLAVKKHGKLDIMFGNAGITGNIDLSISGINHEDFQRVFGVNVYGAFLGAKHAARVMIPAKRGSIIFTSSVASVILGDVPHTYAASKHAVAGLTKSLCVELGRHGIRVNCISPFGVATPLLRKDLGGAGKEVVEDLVSEVANLKEAKVEAEDVAQAAVYLGSDESKLADKVALVTRGASGIGESTARLFAQQGAKVVIADVQDDQDLAVCKTIGTDISTSYVRCDVSKETDVQKAVDHAIV